MKINDPIGLFGSFKPALFLLIALTTFLTASFWPIIDLLILLAIFERTFFSFDAIDWTVIPVIMLTTSCIFFSSTISRFSLEVFSHFLFSFSRVWIRSFSESRSFAAISNFCCLIALIFSDDVSEIFSSSSVTFLETLMLVICTLEPASSNASMALSGKNLSVIYLFVKWTHALTASSVYTTLWWSSYLYLIFIRISIVSLTEEGWTIIFWNLLSSAPSFSMCCLYSFNVVAPIHCNSPLAKAGLNMLDASSDPDAPPAPTSVCISSIKRIISLFFSNSVIILFNLSSNWPLYLVPATIAARSSIIILLLNKFLDTFFSTILRAKPSAIADFPTPGSPTRIGLFFFLLLNICETLSISLCLPTIGSNFPSLAYKVKSLPKLSKTGVFVLGAVFLLWGGSSVDGPNISSSLTSSSL